MHGWFILQKGIGGRGFLPVPFLIAASKEQ